MTTFNTIKKGIITIFAGAVLTLSFTTTEASAAPAKVTAISVVEETPSAIEHKVAKGETLYKIAKKYNVAIGTILAYNPSVVPEKIKINQIVSIPVIDEEETSETSELTRKKAVIKSVSKDGLIKFVSGKTTYSAQAPDYFLAELEDFKKGKTEIELMLEGKATDYKVVTFH